MPLVAIFGVSFSDILFNIVVAGLILILLLALASSRGI